MGMENQEGKRDISILVVGLILGLIAFLSFSFTLYKYITNEKDREYFKYRLKNIKKIGPFE
jgi:hypothetical protein